MSEKMKRIIMTVVGVSLSGVAVGFFNYSAFGMDPFQVLAHGLWNLTPLEPFTQPLVLFCSSLC